MRLLAPIDFTTDCFLPVNIIDFVKYIYCTYLGLEINNKNKRSVLHKVCYVCVKDLKKKYKKKKKVLKFAVLLE